MYPSIPAEGRHHVSVLCRALSHVILRLHLHRESSREVEGNKLKHTPPAPQGAMCEICIQSFINLFICYAWVILVCKVLCCVSFEKGEETVICVLLIIVQLHGCPVITHVYYYRAFVH